MNRERLYLFDTTLRDGALTTGVDFSLEDKRHIAGLLDELGVDYVEGGYPGANPLDTRFFERKPTRRARFCAFGMTKRPGRSAANDPGVAASPRRRRRRDRLRRQGVGLSRPRRVRLHAGGEPRVHRGQRARRGRRGPRGDGRLRAFLRRLQGQSRPMRWQCARRRSRRARAGSCSATPMAARCRDEVERIVREVGDASSPATGSAFTRITIPTTRWPIRWRRCGRARGKSRDAERSRRALRQRQSDFADPDAGAETRLRRSFRDRRLRRGACGDIAKVSHALDELLNRAPDRHAPYVGASAFATKAGIHASALAKDPRTYEHVPPERVGNARAILVSDQAGRSNLDRCSSTRMARRRERRSAPFAGARRGQVARSAGLRL